MRLSDWFDRVNRNVKDLTRRVHALEQKWLELESTIAEWEGMQMSAMDDLRTNVQALDAAVVSLQAEDTLVLGALSDLAAKVAAGGTVSEADVQAVADQVKASAANIAAEVTRVSEAVDTADPATPSPAAPAEAPPAEAPPAEAPPGETP